jgi:threonine dehydrogenase-like Zn-dependent dehydrogenase
MKAIVYSNWETLTIEEIQKPIPKADEVLVRVAACGICGSELDALRTRNPRRRPPLVLGHEFCGYVEAVGSDVSTWTQGQPVISHGIAHCGDCRYCLRGDTNLCASRQVFGMHRPGAFAEFVTVPSRALFSWPAGLSPEDASFAEPLANGINVLRLDPLQKKDRVLVIGAGPIGLMCVAAAKILCNSSIAVSDLIPERLKVAKTFGAGYVANPNEKNLSDGLADYWDGLPPDYVIDAVGSASTKKSALELVAPGGTAVWTGLHDNTLTFDSYAITLQQKRVLGSYSGNMRDVKQSIDLLASGLVDVKSWIRVFPLEKGVTAFKRMLAAKGDDMKAVVQMA